MASNPSVWILKSGKVSPYMSFYIYIYLTILGLVVLPKPGCSRFGTDFSTIIMIKYIIIIQYLVCFEDFQYPPWN